MQLPGQKPAGGARMGGGGGGSRESEPRPKS